MQWWGRPKYRKIFFQLAAAGLVVAFFAFVVVNTYVNLGNIHQDISFAFLEDPAGFRISQRPIPYQLGDSYGRVFVIGLLNTLLVSLLAIITSSALGVFIGVLRLSRNWLLKQIAGWYVDIFRNVPLLLQLFFWYFAVLAFLPSPRDSSLKWGCGSDRDTCLFVLNNRGLSTFSVKWDALSQGLVSMMALAIVIALALYLVNRHRQRDTGRVISLWWLYLLLIFVLPLGVYLLRATPQAYELPRLAGFNYQGGITILPELMALWLAMTLYSAAYIAEYVRAGIQSVAPGQREAAASLGLSETRIMTMVILPQALRVIVPPLTNQYLNVVKNSSLATAIAYPDLVSVFTGTSLNQTGRAIEIIAMTMAVYLLISLIISFVMNRYNRRLLGKACR